MNMAPGQRISDAMTDSGYRSFMDSGDSVFQDEAVTKDKQGNVTKNRSQVIDRVRQNIITRMKQENDLSKLSAVNVGMEHRARAQSIADKVNKINRKKAEYREAREWEQQNQNRGGLFMGVRKAYNRHKIGSIQRDRSALGEKIEQDARKWERYRADYSKNVFRRHYEKYDNYAKSWYELTHEFSDEALGPEPEVPEELPSVQELAPENAVEAEAQELANHPRQGEGENILAQEPVNQTGQAGNQGEQGGNQEGQGEGLVGQDVGGQAAVNQAAGGENPANPGAGDARRQAIAAREDAIRRRNEWLQRRDSFRARRKIPAEAAKQIIEYIGVYDLAGITALIPGLEDDGAMDQVPVTADRIPIQDNKALKEGSRNAMLQGNQHLKAHTRTVMYSQAGENGLRTRFKFRNDFTGIKSKRQFTEENPNTLSADLNMPPADQREEVQAGDANLESDEKDLGGRFLYSETNAEILHANLKRNGETVHGFYMNGEFLSDEQADRDTILSGKKDMKFFGRRNWDKQEKAEKLRTAIRKSPFFQHVNARTIQYYAGYNADIDYSKAIKNEEDAAWLEAAGIEKAEGIPYDANREDIEAKKNEVLETLNVGPQELEGAFAAIDDKLKGPALGTYLKGQIEGGHINEGGNQNLIAFAANSHAAALKTACTILLSADAKPDYWLEARNIARKHPRILASQTKYMMDKLPESGVLMRMTLLECLRNDGGASILEPTALTVHKRELENKRGVKAWFQRNFWNGNLVSYGLEAINAGFTASDSFSDIARYKKNKDWMNTPEGNKLALERADRQFGILYGQIFTKGMNLTTVLSLGALGAGYGLEKLGGVEAAGGKTRSLGFQAMDLFVIFGSLAEIIGKITKFIKYIFRSKEEKEKEAKQIRDDLHSLDSEGTFGQILDFASSLITLVDTARDLASHHVMAQKDKTEIGVRVDKKWGNILQFGGTLNYCLTMGKNLIQIVKDIGQIVQSTKKISRITEADKDIESAITAFERGRQNEGQQAQDQQARDQQNPADNAPGQGENRASAAAAGPNGANPAEQANASMGKAALENSNVQYFMSLTKMKARKQRSQAGWDIANQALVMGKETLRKFGVVGAPITLIGMGVLTVAPLLTQFAGWAVGKLKYDRQNFKNNIASMLGDKSYADTPYFDKVLKRETGIVSSSYLVDLARIFTSIDTHVLTQNPRNDGERELGKTMARTLYGNVKDSNLNQIQLEDLLKNS
ncbi:MAG: hypothetical protein K5989_08310, partial [Lachnospiraceae bacterium]|nr:hypothetical protein [Lachnospiraceae bacterium]